ncbi:MAG: bifunctional metallophosphatase/5'-nucleotidase [Tumebacillaceae bacterium]
MTKKVILLHTNDLHAHYDNATRVAAYIKARRAELEATGEKVLVLDGGDHLDMSVLDCIGTNGQISLDLLADIGYHAMTAGNNELLRCTPEQIRHLSQTTSVPWLLNNLREADGSRIGGMVDHLLIDLGDGVKVGVFGATDLFGDVYEQLFGFQNVETLAAARRSIQELRAQGATLIVMLSHLSLKADILVAEELGGETDVIIGAHCHTALSEPQLHAGTLIVQAGCYGHYVGELRLELDEATGKIVAHDGHLHRLTEADPQDETARALLDKGRLESERYFSEELTTFEHSLTHDEAIKLSAEALRDYWQAEIGLMLGAAAVDGLPAGPVTKGSIYGSFKSMINPAHVKIQGHQIPALLQQSQEPEIYERLVAGNGYRPQGVAIGHLQFAGVTWEMDADGSCQNIQVNGEPLDTERWYHVGTGEHLHYPRLTGYTAMTGSEMLETHDLVMLRDVLCDFLLARSVTRSSTR